MKSGRFQQVWAVDFEFSALPGERQHPICLVAHELGSEKTIQVWEDELHRLHAPPYPLGQDSLFIAYYSSAELGCHLALGWDLPLNILDLYVEYRNFTNGIRVPCGNDLLGALTFFDLDGIDAAEKGSMRQLALRGGPWTDLERSDLLDYCQSDVVALKTLHRKMEPYLDLPRALIRGHYMKAAARMEHTGIPIDVEALLTLRESWPQIRETLIAEINPQYGVYEGHTFKHDRFELWLEKRGIWWPRHPSGALRLDRDTFRDRSRQHPELEQLRQLRHILSRMKSIDIAVGGDGRNRCLLSAFSSRTGRNQPSTTAYIFGQATWIRGLIRPSSGWGIAYLDWSQQEFGIAAALSGDPSMIKAYRSGDPYLAFAKQAGAVPGDATKQTHPHEREHFKTCALGVLYGKGVQGLSKDIERSEIFARELLQLHRRAYHDFWNWSDAAVDCAMLRNRLWTTYGWNVHVGPDPNPRFFRNFPMQANGAEMLRFACCFATEKGIRVCAPVHDALLIEAPLKELGEAVQVTREAMNEASRIVLDGFILRTDVKEVRAPDRYMDERGREMWDLIWDIAKNTE